LKFAPSTTTSKAQCQTAGTTTRVISTIVLLLRVLDAAKFERKNCGAWKKIPFNFEKELMHLTVMQQWESRNGYL
jgi:hypothetical protein